MNNYLPAANIDPKQIKLRDGAKSALCEHKIIVWCYEAASDAGDAAAPWVSPHSLSGYTASYRLIIGILQIAIKDKQSTVNKQKQQKEVQVCTGVAHY